MVVVLQLVDQLLLVRVAELEVQQAVQVVVHPQQDQEMLQHQLQEMETLLVLEQDLDHQQAVVHLHKHQEVDQHQLQEMDNLLVLDKDLLAQEVVENKYY